ncbi:MAG: hypothetical protein UV61_C0034G0009 [Candidatus Gottesmanbacteria bacterium GW2011_GWB1_43_11]|uniref:Uncharacterized protein n=1 Tax=Candidatus Gottesmanbacteria bacterium GW2011_GWB1_43_11 TaxID=1618446 RepID=A0A0G1CES7_9BACT|nr:MAG: hypothetical protein UV61_C0034G0009 [Candidatus Gottesmanbacteria bacterium GW2011_GWB1_43_11]
MFDLVPIETSTAASNGIQGGQLAVVVAVSWVVVACHKLVCGELIEEAVTGVVVEVLGAEVVTGVVVAVVVVEVACPELVEGAVIAVVVEVVGVVVAVVGRLVIVVVVEVVIVGVEVAVGVINEGVEVAVGSRIISSGVSEIIVSPRCLLSHSATAVTPSCHDS